MVPIGILYLYTVYNCIMCTLWWLFSSVSIRTYIILYIIIRVSTRAVYLCNNINVHLYVYIIIYYHVPIIPYTRVYVAYTGAELGAYIPWGRYMRIIYNIMRMELCNFYIFFLSRSLTFLGTTAPLYTRIRTRIIHTHSSVIIFHFSTSPYIRAVYIYSVFYIHVYVYNKPLYVQRRIITYVM